MMNNVSHKKGWLSGAMHVHVYPPPIYPIKNELESKSENFLTKILLRHPMSATSDLYEYKMALFEMVNQKNYS